MDVLVVVGPGGRFGRDLGRVGGARRPAQGRRRRSVLLGRWPPAWCPGRLYSPALAAVAWLGRDLRGRSRPRLYLSGGGGGGMVFGFLRQWHRDGGHWCCGRRHEWL